MRPKEVRNPLLSDQVPMSYRGDPRLVSLVPFAFRNRANRQHSQSTFVRAIEREGRLGLLVYSRPASGTAQRLSYSKLRNTVPPIALPSDPHLGTTTYP